jgi:hypothetical protein
MLRPKRTFQSVVEELTDGLERGSITLASEAPHTGESYNGTSAPGAHGTASVKSVHPNVQQSGLGQAGKEPT